MTEVKPVTYNSYLYLDRDVPYYIIPYTARDLGQSKLFALVARNIHYRLNLRSAKRYQMAKTH